jgi:peptidyl-prolyl cis-trans isomerase B (cyclophilin B)
MHQSSRTCARLFALMAIGLCISIGFSGCARKTEDVAIVFIDDFIASAEIDTTQDGWKTRLPEPPMAAFDPAHDYFWHLKTGKGDIVIRFMPSVAPMHVTSTIYLTNLGFYDGLTFHRIIPRFMAQGGCPLGVGRGGPGYQYAGEFSPDVKHDRSGLLSMANAGPNTDGSQFFITFVPTPHLDGRHTIFGEVVEGMQTLEAIEAVGSSSGAPSEPVVIEAAVIAVKKKS